MKDVNVFDTDICDNNKNIQQLKNFQQLPSKLSERTLFAV